MFATPVAFNDLAVIAGIMVVLGTGAAYAARQKADLRRVERKLDALLKQQGVPPPVPPVVGEVSDEVQQIALDPTRRIEAIKLHREQTGCGLADAKRDVERFIRNVN
jgi:ribosomal protein L7/L12